MHERLLEIRDLYVDLMTARGIVYALQGMDLSVGVGEIHGLVGESGCGKSITAKTVLRLLDRRRTRMRGSVLFEDRDLLRASEHEMRAVRGNRVSMIFQDPMVSLNPLMTVGDQIAEIYLNHFDMNRAQAKKKTLEMLELVGIQPPEKRLGQYPFELSGGLQQRVMIAMAAACRPALLIADEPTTALDVTIQAQILELLKTLQKELDMSILLITHNFGIVAEVCDRVSVMYAGKVIETADTREIFRNAAHPYSRQLIESIPRPGGESEYLPTIPGSPPRLFERIQGCAFAPRCKFSGEPCLRAPALQPLPGADGHLVACPFSRPEKEEQRA